MLRRDRQFRVRLHQILDGGIFALGLWAAHQIRFSLGLWVADYIQRKSWGEMPALLHWAKKVELIGAFAPDFFRLFLIVIPMAPLVLEWQGFYRRPMFSSLPEMSSQLGRSCFICSLGLISIAYMLKPGVSDPARSVYVYLAFAALD